MILHSPSPKYRAPASLRARLASSFSSSLWVTRTSAEEIGEATERRRGVRARWRRARARDDELLLGAKKTVNHKRFMRVQEATEAAPHFQARPTRPG